MNFNYTIINEFVSFIILFYFSCFFIFPKIINILNNFNLINFKNISLIKFNQTIESILINKILKDEKQIKLFITLYLNNLNELFVLKKNNFKKIVFFEKNNLINNIKKIFKIKKNDLIKNFFCELKIFFIKSFKNIYNEIISYNNEFIINYEM